jgi:hypothetical protein
MTTSKEFKKLRRPQKKNHLFLIPLDFRGNPFLGLALLEVDNSPQSSILNIPGQIRSLTLK